MRTVWWSALMVLLAFTRTDGHKVWINKEQIVSIQGAGQLGLTQGTLITTLNSANVVKENVNQVIRKLREPDDKAMDPANCLCK